MEIQEFLGGLNLNANTPPVGEHDVPCVQEEREPPMGSNHGRLGNRPRRIENYPVYTMQILVMMISMGLLCTRIP